MINIADFGGKVKRFEKISLFLLTNAFFYGIIQIIQAIQIIQIFAKG